MALDDGLLQGIMRDAAALREPQAAVDPLHLFLIIAGPLFQAEKVLLRLRLGQAAGQRIVEDDQVVDVAHQHTEAAAGDANVTVRVKIRNNPGILGMTLKLSYDAAAAELVDSASGVAVGKLNYTKPGKYKNGCIFTWYAEQLSAGDVADGDILVLTFRVPDTTPAGAYPITLSFTDGDVFDRDLQTVSLKIENGNIK